MQYRPLAPTHAIAIVPVQAHVQALVHFNFGPSIARRAKADRRWPVLCRTLVALRRSGRRSIRIVDVGCGAGELLIHAACRARAIGFLAVECLGVDRNPRAIARARAAARVGGDPGIGFAFQVAEPRAALDAETEFPADILLYASTDDPDLERTAAAAGVTALCAPLPSAGPAAR